MPRLPGGRVAGVNDAAAEVIRPRAAREEFSDSA
jgi:hypothetical protein